MSRKVYISSDMSVDERLIEVAESNPIAALIWPWILTSFDDWGRSEASPKRLKAKIFPSNNLITADKIDKALKDYAAHGLIELYEVDKKVYMAIPKDKWFKWQTHIRKEKRTSDESKNPAPLDITESRDCAQMREDSSKNIPSPSTLPPFHPSPTPSVKDIRGQAPHFTPPTLEEVRDYCQERQNNVDPQKWVDHYTSNGWKVGKNKMVDWRAAVRTWEGENKNKAAPKSKSEQIIELVNSYGGDGG